VPRLEDVQRQMHAREEQRAGQRKDRQAHGLRLGGHPNRIAESLRRCADTQGSSSPTTSNNLSNWVRAALSFQSRSAAMIASSESAAASRSPAAICPPASSKRLAWSSGCAATSAA